MASYPLRRIAIASLALAAALSARGEAAGAGRNAGAGREALAPVLDALPGRIEAAIEEDRLVSVSLAVVLDGELVFCRAFGHADLERRLPATPETVYPIGSITKVFVATMLAQLWERGSVDLEDPVQRYLPEYRPLSPLFEAEPTTLRQLASHTSGLPRDAPVNFWTDYAGFLWLVTGGQTPMTFYVDCDSLLASLDGIELVNPPDVHAHYANLNMQILGLALERACGMPFDDYIETEIIAPLGMKDTRFTLDRGRRERLARGYVCTSADGPMLEAPTYEFGCAEYSGGIFSTARDLARFVAFQFDETPATRRRVLSVPTLRRMRTPQSIHRPGVRDCWGLGWGIVQIGGREAIEHNGAMLGYHAHASAIPHMRLGIVAMSNTKNFLWRPGACKELARSILADLADALEASAEEGDFDPSTLALEDFAGEYELPGGFARLVVRAERGVLRAALPDVEDFSEEFIPVGPLTFCFGSDPGRTPVLFFERSEDGTIDRVTFLSHTFRRPAPRRTID